MNAQQIHRLRIRTRKLKAQNKALSQQAGPAFGGPLTTKQAADLTRSAVNLRYGPQEQDLQRQAMASDIRQGQTHDYYTNYLNVVNAAKESQAQAQAAAVSQIRGDQGTAQASDQGAQGKRDEVAAQLAKLTGGNFDSGRSTEAAAESNRKALGDINVAQLAKTGAADTTYLGNRAATGAAYETRAHLDESGRKRKLEADLGALEGQKGQYAVSYQDQLRKEDLNNQIAQSAGLIKQQQLGLNAQLASSLIGDRKSGQKHQSRADRLAEQKASETQRHNVASEDISRTKGNKKGRAGKESENSQKVKASILGIEGEYAGLLKQGLRPGQIAPQIRANAQKAKKPLPEWMLEAAADLANFGYVRPARRRQLKSIGVRVPKSWATAPAQAPKYPYQSGSSLHGVLPGV